MPSSASLSVIAEARQDFVAAASERRARDLDHSLIRGIAWMGAVRWSTQLVSWGATLMVARLLRPTDYGLVGMAIVCFGFLQLVNELGLGAAIVQRRDLTGDQIARLGGLAVLFGGGFVILSVLLSGAVAQFFGEAAVRWIILVFSFTFLTSALQIVPRALLTRDLDFRRLALADGAEALVAACTTLALAAVGLRYWALVFGPLVGRVTTTVLTNVWRPHRLAWPRESHSIAGAVNFGWQVVVARIAWYFYSSADFILVGRVLGKAALGTYMLGSTIAGIPVDRVSVLLASVMPAVFSAVQHDRLALRRYLRNLTEGLAFITFPASVGIALIADDLVLLALGEHWRSAILPLRLLALSSALRSVSMLLPQLAISTGHARRNMQLTILSALILPGLFYVGTRWGTAGVAAAWVVGHPVCVIPLFLVHALHLTGLPLSEYLGALSPAAAGTLGMAGAVLGLRWVMPDWWHPGAGLAMQVIIGALVYAAVLYTAYPQRIRALWTLLRALRT